MAGLNISGEFSKLESIYIHKLLDIVSSLSTKNGYIIWQVEIYFKVSNIINICN